MGDTDRRLVTAEGFTRQKEFCAIRPLTGFDAEGFGEGASHEDLDVGSEIEDSCRTDGWWIVRPRDPILEYLRGGKRPDGLEDAVHVYKHDDLGGELLLGVWRLTVVLRRRRGKCGIRFLEKRCGCEVLRRHLWSPSAYSVRIPRTDATADDLFSYAEDVARSCGRKLDWAFPEFLFRADPRCSDELATVAAGSWHWGKIRIEKAWPTSTGKETKIAVIDQGFALDHPDIENEIEFETSGAFSAGTGDFTPGSGSLADGTIGHGTACAGLAAALPCPLPEAAQPLTPASGCNSETFTSTRPDGSEQVVGAAPKARLMLLRVGNYPSAPILADALCHAMRPGVLVEEAVNRAPADIVTCSLRVPGVRSAGLSMPLARALSSLASNGRGRLGMPVCWAVENGSVKIESGEPAYRSDVIAVGNSDCADKRFACGWGPGLDLLAPGQYINVAAPPDWEDTGRTKGAGTSFATPVVAGVAGLILSANPYLTAAEVKHVLTATCHKIMIDKSTTVAGVPCDIVYDADGWCPYVGHGRVDAKEAVDESVDMRTCCRRIRYHLLKFLDWLTEFWSS